MEGVELGEESLSMFQVLATSTTCEPENNAV